uniref:Phosphatidylcholine-sterol acyltransferase n=2 Tax=Anthurium amnicola TaxID=1678845 RepID=A0A1D1ZEL9_9ARAE
MVSSCRRARNLEPTHGEGKAWKRGAAAQKTRFPRVPRWVRRTDGDISAALLMKNYSSRTVCRDLLRSRNFLSGHSSPATLMDDIFIRLLTLTSRLSHRFIRFIEDLVYRDAERRPQHSQFPFDVLHQAASCHTHQAVTDNCSSSLSNSDACVCLCNSDRRESDRQRCFLVNVHSGILQKQGFFGGPPIVKGLTFPLHSFRLVCRSTLNSLRYLFIYAKHGYIQLCGFVSRVKTTLRGSSQDIGWLERTEGLPPVEDGTTRFMELLYDIRNGKHSLPNSFVYLLIPGLFSNHSPMYFVNTKKFFSKMGLACHIAKIHSEASVEKNAWELKKYIEELYWGSGKRVLILGHSKGGIDAAAALSIYWSDLKDKVAGLALAQSPYGGSPVASDILREGQVADKEARSILEFIVCKLIKGDIRALEDLTYEKRREFISKHRLPAEQIPLVSFHTEASVSPGVLATASHIAHAELLPAGFGTTEGWRVPVVAPVAAAMAACALHLRVRYGERSDGLVTRRDAEVPGSVAVRLERKLDHGWMVYASRRENRAEADACEMCEALLALLVEMGGLRAPGALG